LLSNERKNFFPSILLHLLPSSSQIPILEDKKREIFS